MWWGFYTSNRPSKSIKQKLFQVLAAVFVENAMSYTASNNQSLRMVTHGQITLMKDFPFSSFRARSIELLAEATHFGLLIAVATLKETSNYGNRS